MSEKRAYTPTEFAALFGKEKTWTYRLLYAGKIKRLSEDYGRIMIPVEEAGKIAADSHKYKKAKGDDISKEVAQKPAAVESQTKGAAQWMASISRKRAKSTRCGQSGPGPRK